MLLRTCFLAVPKEIEEAAIVDGASSQQIFTRVMLPIVSPGIVTVALIIGLLFVERVPDRDDLPAEEGSG